MAFGRSAKVWPTEERVRSFLRLSWRRGRLFFSYKRTRQGRSLGRRCFDPSSRLSDRFARQSRRRRSERVRQIRTALHGQSSFQRATLALGGSRRRGGVGPLAEAG